MIKKTIRKVEEAPRPPCSQCGAPADCVVELSVRYLEVEHDSGRYVWVARYRNPIVETRFMLCDACRKQRITVDSRVDLRVAAKGGKDQ